MVKPKLQKSGKAQAKKLPAKKSIFDSRLLRGALALGALVILFAFCVKEEPPPVTIAPVVAPMVASETVAPPAGAGGATAEVVTSAAEQSEVPSASRVSLRFKTPIMRNSPGVEILAEGTGTNGDPLIFEYEWRVNREPVPEVSGPILPWDKLKRGDRISLSVTPIDGETRGKQVISGEIVLPNSPPQFVSTPMLNFQSAEYVYEAKAEDADQDPLTYKLEAGPAGMVVDTTTGRLSWLIGREQAGNHVVKLVVTDPAGGRAVQEYTLSVVIPKGDMP